MKTVPGHTYAIIILGATGDLARRKLVPALSRLCEKKTLCPSAVIVGCGRTPLEDQTFRSLFDVPVDFKKRLFYHRSITGLRLYLESHGRFKRIIIFMALPPEVYVSSTQALAEEGFGPETSLIIEKPFGWDFDSARALNVELERFFSESQIFRIDHYLAKEAVRNILVLRFANTVFSEIWNSRHISAIQISALETGGVGMRGSYFDKAGILRDMVQNHLLQLLCLLTMEAPATLGSEDIRARKIDALKTLRVDSCRKWQYRGYREEKDVSPDSEMETFAELRVFLDNERWAGMPVDIRAGKAANRSGAEIGILFKPVPRALFNKNGDVEPNKIIIKIQPKEGVILDVSTRVPGAGDVIHSTAMNFCYRDLYRHEWPDAYEKLLQDALDGDHTLFVNSEETELAWQKMAPALEAGLAGTYAPGTLPENGLNIGWIDFEQYCKNNGAAPHLPDPLNIP